MKIKNREELIAKQEEYRASLNSQRKQILICAGTGCVAGGSLEIYAKMKDIIECVKTGEVTYAVRDTSINGITIKIDDIMGIDDDGIKKVGQDVEKVTLELLEEMVDEDSELISIYYGADTTKEQAEALLEKVEETYGDCDVQLEYGGQPIYYFLLSVE